jgi:opacity protein-like surface antigen
MNGKGIRNRAQLSLAVVLCLLLCRRPASAQEVRKDELSAGYAYLRVDSSAGTLSLHGVSFSLARNITNWLAVVGDGGGYHLEGFRLGTVQAGPRFTARPTRRISLSSQALLGFAHANAGGRGFPAYHESVAWTVGGGLDCRLNDRVSLRVAQAEYMQTRLGGQVQHNFRAGAGIVLNFGAR